MAKTATASGGGAQPHMEEGCVAKMIEQQTTRIHSDAFLWAAGAPILGSLALQALGQKKDSFLSGNGRQRF